MLKSRTSSLLAMAAALLLSAAAVSACTLPDALPQVLQLAMGALAGAGLSPDLAGQGVCLAATAAVAAKMGKAAPPATDDAPPATDDAALNAQALAQAGADRQAGDLPLMTLAEAAMLVGIPAADVLSFRDHGTHVVVVSVAGQKLTTA